MEMQWKNYSLVNLCAVGELKISKKKIKKKNSWKGTLIPIDVQILFAPLKSIYRF